MQIIQYHRHGFMPVSVDGSKNFRQDLGPKSTVGWATLLEYNRTSKPSTDKPESRLRLFKMMLEL